VSRKIGQKMIHNPLGTQVNIEDNFPTARSRQDDSSQTLILDS